MELWIAEPVVWEWADHLREDRASLNSVRTRLVAAGIAMNAQPTEIEDALEFVHRGIDSLGDHVRIVSIGPVVLEAMKDQILVRSPGERMTKEGRAVKNRNEKAVKTGAADSAIYRAYHHYAKEKTDSYVILSGDSDVAKAHKSWGIEGVRIFRSTDALNEHIFRMIQTPAHLVSACVGFLHSNIGEIDLTSFESPNSLVGWVGEERPLAFAATGSKLLMGLSAPKLDKVSQIVTAEACIITDLFGPEVTRDMYGDSHEEPGTQRLYEDSAVYVGVTFDVDQGVVRSFSIGPARHVWVIQTQESGWDEDGPLAVLENLVDVPGLADFDWPVSFYESQEKQVEVDGDFLQLEFSGSAAADWVLTATYRGEQVQVVGTQQGDGMYSLGGKSFDYTVLFSTDSTLVPNHPSFAVNALIMHTPQSA